jgi:hypothetical protein
VSVPTEEATGNTGTVSSTVVNAGSTAKCEAGKVATGGGYTLTPASETAQAQVVVDKRGSTGHSNEWSVRIERLQNINPVSVVANAICVPGT